MVIVIQYNECASCYQIVSNLVKIVNFIFIYLATVKKNAWEIRHLNHCIIKLGIECNLQGLIEIMECRRYLKSHH